jgi:hypothetical protein
MGTGGTGGSGGSGACDSPAVEQELELAGSYLALGGDARGLPGLDVHHHLRGCSIDRCSAETLVGDRDQRLGPAAAVLRSVVERRRDGRRLVRRHPAPRLSKI